MPGWKLFLDDEREPVGTGWTVCTCLNEVIQVCQYFGLPSEISFDHDLGDGPSPPGYENTGMGLARWIVDRVLDGEYQLPKDFTYYVHSQNPIGRMNIKGLMEQFLQEQRNV